MSDAIDALFAAVWANPEDDATRLVLADALLAIGDPRGELIHLQFSDRHDEGAARRLLQRHGMTWLGALRGNVIPLAYEKGFLASCMVTDAEGAAGCGEWGTVHTVQLQDVAHLPLLEGMAILRAVIHAEPEIVAKLVKLPVAWRLEALGATESQPLAVAHTALECLPRLRIAEAPAFRLSRAVGISAQLSFISQPSGTGSSGGKDVDFAFAPLWFVAVGPEFYL